MRSHRSRKVLLPLCLGLVVAALAGCMSSASPVATATETPAAPPPPGGIVEYDASTRAGALLLAAGAEVDESILPAGFRYVETVEIDRSGSMSSIYVQGQPEEQGPGLYVHAVHTGVAVESIADDWVAEPLPELSGEESVSVASDPTGQDRSVVTIDAPPAGTVRLIGDGVPRDDLVATAARLLDSMG